MNTRISKKTVAVTTVSFLVALVAVVASAAQNEQAPQNPEALALRALLASHPKDAAIQGKTTGLSALEAEEARLNRSKTLTPDQLQSLSNEKGALAVRHALTTGSNRASSFQQPPAAPHGIFEATEIGAPLPASDFVALNSWGGQLNGKVVGVYSGYRPEDPLRGVLVIFDAAANVHGTFYDLPGAPTRITAEESGVLTLNSRGGVYRFDLATRQFK